MNTVQCHTLLSGDNDCHEFKFSIDSQKYPYLSQTHIVNLPIGLDGPERAKNAVRVEGIKWQSRSQSRWKSGVGIGVETHHHKYLKY